MIGLLTYMTFAALFVLPMMLLLSWTGMLAVWMLAWWTAALRLMAWPLVLIAVAMTGWMIVAGHWLHLGFHGPSLMHWSLLSTLLVWVLPVVVGIWMAQRYPLRKNSSERTP